MKTRNPRTRFELNAALLVILLCLLLAGATACRPRPAPDVPLETGWIPGPTGSPIEATYEVQDGLAVYQGDMLFDLEDLHAYQEQVEAEAVGDDGWTTLAAVSKGRSWPDAVVIYDESSIAKFADVCLNEYAGGCLTTQEDAIRQAIVRWDARTDFEFRPRESGDENWIEFVKGKICGSFVGYSPPDWPHPFLPPVPLGQEIILAKHCDAESVTHEIGHAIGLHHEHQRTDRDRYILYQSWNVKKGKGYNFQAKGTAWGEYDYRSIMHYSAYFLGRKDPATGDPLATMVPLIDLPEGLMGIRLGLSKLDVLAGNALAEQALTGFLPSDARQLFEPAGTFPDFGSAPSQVALGRVDGDDYEDLIGFRPSDGPAGSRGEVIVARGRADGSFGPTELWNSAFCSASDHCRVGDVDGDGLDDAVSYDRVRGDVIVALSDGNRFVGSSLWQAAPFVGVDEMRLADVNADCLEDLVVFLEHGGFANPLQMEVHVALSTGDGFGAFELWADVEAAQVVGLERMNDDGPVDLVVADENGDVLVHLSSGTSFGDADLWGERLCADRRCKLALINDDWHYDLVAEDPEGDHFLRRVQVTTNTGIRFADEAPYYHELDCESSGGCLYTSLNTNKASEAIEVRSLDGAGTEIEVAWSGFRTGGVGVTDTYYEQTCTEGTPPPAASPWVQATDFPVDDIVGVGPQAYARVGNTIHQQLGDLDWRAFAGGWVDMAATRNQLYGLSLGDRIYDIEPNGTYVDIMRGYTDVITGVHTLYGLHSTGRLYERESFCGGYTPGLTPLSDPGAYTFVAGGNRSTGSWDGASQPTLYRMGSGVHRLDYGACSWQYIGGTYSVGIWAGGEEVYVQHSNGILRRYNEQKRDYFGYPRVWDTIGDAGADHAIDPQSGVLYRLSADKSQIDRYDGVPGQWTRVGGPADRIWATPGQVWASSPGSGSVFRLAID